MKVLHNPTDKKFEFLYGGQLKIVPANSDADFGKEVVRHYVQHVKGPLEVKEIDSGELEGGLDAESSSTLSFVHSLSWNELQKEATKYGVYKFGASREEIVILVAKAMDKEYESNGNSTADEFNGNQ